MVYLVIKCRWFISMNRREKGCGFLGKSQTEEYQDKEKKANFVQGQGEKAKQDTEGQEEEYKNPRGS